MKRPLRLLVPAAVLVIVLSGCSSSSSGGGDDAKTDGKGTTKTQGTADTGDETGRDGSDTGAKTATPPDGAFPDFMAPASVKGVDDQAGDWGFFDGSSPGRSDDFVDFTHLWFGRATPTDDQLADLAAMTCGRSGETTLVCPAAKTAPPSGDYLVVTAQLAADAKQAGAEGEGGRYTLLIDGGGDEATKAKASAAAPDLASTGTNMVIEALLGVDDPAQVALNAADGRTPSVPFATATRILVHGEYVTWMIPAAEVGEGLAGFRAAAIWGDPAKAGEAAANDADVVPGPQHAPFSLLKP